MISYLVKHNFYVELDRFVQIKLACVTIDYHIFFKFSSQLVIHH